MRSMTAYGRAEEQAELFLASVEMRGCNNRFLDIVISLPPFLQALEIPIREFLAARCRRGRIEAYCRYREYDAPLSVSLNREAAKAYWEAAAETARNLGLDEQPRLDTILAMDGVLEAERKIPEQAAERLMPLLERAFAAFDSGREREGAHTRRDILTFLSLLEKSRDFIASQSGELERAFKETVKSRFEEVLGTIDENRVLAETAALLIKYSISEELSRLEAHLAAFRSETEENPAPGKKLDFLSQEMNREINTIGSKSAALEVSREVVNMKEALENIREQLRNVE